jgi:Fur family ferric uptake transcriptional regulator
MADEKQLLAGLDAAGHNATDARREIAALVAAQAGHFTALDLLETARRERRPVARATVFRTLELLAQAGLIERLDLPNGEHAYVRCEPAHHHHVVCTRCGRTVEIADCGLTAVAAAIKRETGYEIDSHRTELFGTCPDCLVASRQARATLRA